MKQRVEGKLEGAKEQHCSGIPDMRFINREVKIAEVASSLDLKLDGSTRIHCWHPDRHKNGDRSASVGIRTSNNTVKCFGCDSKPMGPVDLVMDVLTVSPADAALWIAARFPVPLIPARKRLRDSSLRRESAGYAHGLALMIHSGLWGSLSEAARSIAPVLLELAERGLPLNQEFEIQISYAGISRYSGIRSPNSIREALIALSDIGFLKLPETPIRRSPERETAKYLVTPYSNQLWEAAQSFARQMQVEIAAEIELRARLRKERIRLLKPIGKESRRSAGT
jgi:hypothetical protein